MDKREQVARAIAESQEFWWYDLKQNQKEDFKRDADAALAAIEPPSVSVREAARVLLDAVRIEPVHDTIVRSVRLTPFCDALRAIAEGKEC